MKFEIGDTVRCIGHTDGGEIHINEIGTVMVSDGEYMQVGVMWDKRSSIRHSLGGKCPNYHGWFVPTTSIELINHQEDGDFTGARVEDIL